MLSEHEKLFVDYWEKNREREGKLANQILQGIPLGLLFSMPVLLLVFTSRFWFKRADMLLAAKTNPWVLIIAVFLITVFFAAFYKRHKWDMKEQQYLELKGRNKE